jgi:hypothetical protein
MPYAARASTSRWDRFISKLIAGKATKVVLTLGAADGRALAAEGRRRHRALVGRFER